MVCLLLLGSFVIDVGRRADVEEMEDEDECEYIPVGLAMGTDEEDAASMIVSDAEGMSL